jgi:MFS family permease
MIPLFFVKYPKLAKDRSTEGHGFSLAKFAEPTAIPIAFFTVIICLGYSGILTFLSDFASQIHMADVASFFFVAYAVFAIISRPFTGRLFDKRGENIVIYPLIIVYAAGMLILSLLQQKPLLLLAGALIGFGYGTVSTMGQAIAVKLSPKERVPLAISTFFMSLDLGIGFSPFLLGVLVPMIGYRGMYFSLAIVTVFAYPVYYFLHGRRASLKSSKC